MAVVALDSQGVVPHGHSVTVPSLHTLVTTGYRLVSAKNCYSCYCLHASVIIVVIVCESGRRQHCYWHENVSVEFRCINCVFSRRVLRCLRLEKIHCSHHVMTVLLLIYSVQVHRHQPLLVILCITCIAINNSSPPSLLSLSATRSSPSSSSSAGSL